VQIKINENQNYLQYGDVIFTASSETPNEAGMSSVVTKKIDEKFYLNSFCFGFRLFNQNIFIPGFLKHLFRSIKIREYIVKTTNGVTRFNISKKKFIDIKIPIPTIEVQNKIFEILDNYDAHYNDISECILTEIKMRQEQYEYYRNKLLTF
jgi:type I restriction enzyme S subunit